MMGRSTRNPEADHPLNKREPELRILIKQSIIRKILRNKIVLNWRKTILKVIDQIRKGLLIKKLTLIMIVLPKFRCHPRL